MSKTIKEIDEDVLEQASQVLGTDSPKDTINVALKEVVRRRMVQEYVAYLRDRDPAELTRDRDEAWR